MQPIALPTEVILVSTMTAGYFDLRRHRIPNWLVTATAALSLAWHATVNGSHAVWMAVAGLLVTLLLLFPLFVLRGLGGGDVKFFGSIGAAVTYPNISSILFMALGIAALMAVYRVVREGKVTQTLTNMIDLIRWFGRRPFKPHPSVHIEGRDIILLPFTVATAIATWAFLFFFSST